MVTHLPSGPTAFFKISGVVMGKELAVSLSCFCFCCFCFCCFCFVCLVNSHWMAHITSQNRGEISEHRPELILNGFNTRLGHSVGRMFAALLPHDPQFKGRQVITFHNQRDFIFVRFHRSFFFFPLFFPLFPGCIEDRTLYSFLHFSLLLLPLLLQIHFQ